MNKENVMHKHIHKYTHTKCTHTTQYYLAIQNEIMSFAGKQMELEIVLSEITQTEVDKYCMFSLV
jgi:hypothetical protein